MFFSLLYRLMAVYVEFPSESQSILHEIGNKTISVFVSGLFVVFHGVQTGCEAQAESYPMGTLG
jgi:hypothetical protein